jgi:hypothetical protein
MSGAEKMAECLLNWRRCMVVRDTEEEYGAGKADLSEYSGQGRRSEASGGVGLVGWFCGEG